MKELMEAEMDDYLLYIDAIHYSVRDNGVMKKLAAYVILEINTDGKKALAALERVTEKWTPKYPNLMKRWRDNWNTISPMCIYKTRVGSFLMLTNSILIIEELYLQSFLHIL